MNSKQFWRSILASILTLSDLAVAIVAFFGGINMLNTNVPAGIGTLFVGTGLLILSFGLWTQNRSMKIMRIAIYACAFLAAALSFGVIGLAKGVSGLWPMPVVTAVLFVVTGLSILHLRLWPRTES